MKVGLSAGAWATYQWPRQRKMTLISPVAIQCQKLLGQGWGLESPFPILGNCIFSDNQESWVPAAALDRTQAGILPFVSTCAPWNSKRKGKVVHERNRARGGKVNDLQAPGTLGLRGSPGSGNRCLMRGQTRPDTERVISGQNASKNGKGERVQVFRAEHGGKSLGSLT